MVTLHSRWLDLIMTVIIKIKLVVAVKTVMESWLDKEHAS